eukprot:4179659-Pyramimonas_sp.AAC.1
MRLAAGTTTRKITITAAMVAPSDHACCRVRSGPGRPQCSRAPPTDGQRWGGGSEGHEDDDDEGDGGGRRVFWK